MARLEVSKATEHGKLTHLVETGSVLSKVRSGRAKVTTPSEDPYIKLCLLRKQQSRRAQSAQVLSREGCSGLRGQVAVSKGPPQASGLVFLPEKWL